MGKYQKKPPSHQMSRYQHKDQRNVKNSEEKKIYEMTEEEFRVILLKKFKELQENTDRKLSEIWKIIYGQHEKFDEEIEIKKVQIRILDLKSAITEIKKSIECFNGRLGKAEERICELEDWTFLSKL